MSRDVSRVEQASSTPRPEPSGPGPAKEYPVREYIGAMCLELAQMARWDGDERLAVLLEAASGRANEPALAPEIVQHRERIARSA